MSKRVRILSSLNERVETGAIQFGDDWPGLFVRGDSALHLEICLSAILAHVENSDDNAIYAPYISFLRSIQREIAANVNVRQVKPGNNQALTSATE